MWTEREIEQIVETLTSDDRPAAAKAALLDILTKHRGEAVLAELGDALVATDRADEARKILDLAKSLAPQDSSHSGKNAPEAGAREVERSPLSPYPNRTAFEAIKTPLIALGRLDVLAEIYDAADPTLVPQSKLTPESQVQQAAGIARSVPPLTIVTLPKSGTAFIGETIMGQLDVPRIKVGLSTFPRNMNVPAWVTNHARGGTLAIEHTDASPHNLRTFKDAGIERILVHVRDPRQSLLSWVHHVDLLLGGQDDLLNQHSPAIPRDYPGYTFEQKMEWHVDNTFGDRVTWIDEWLGAERDPGNGLILSFKTYEQFHEAPERYFDAVYEFFEVTQLVGASEMEVEPTLSNHFRRGETDEWRRVFTDSQQRRMTAKMSDDHFERFGWDK